MSLLAIAFIVGTTVAPAEPPASCTAMWRFNETIGSLPDRKAAYAKLRNIADQCIRDGGDGNAYIFRGHGAYDAGDLKSAESDYREATTLLPASAPAHFDLGLVEFALGNLDAAIAEYTTYIAIKGNEPDGYNARAKIYLAKRDLVHAIADETQAISLRADFTDGYRVRAEARLLSDDFDGAIADCTAGLAAGGTGGFHALRGAAYRHKKEFVHAAADLDIAVRNEPDDPLGWKERAQLEMDRSQWDAAIPDFRQALVLDPQSVWAHQSLGMILRQQKQYDASIAEYGKAIAVTPDAWDLYLGRALSEFHKQDYAATVADDTTALSKNPVSEAALSNRGFAYRHLGKLDEAIADLTRALAMVPNDDAALVERGIAHRQKHEYDGAEADYDAAISDDPKDSIAILDRGMLWQDEKRFDRAEADFDASAALDPGSWKAQTGRCRIRAIRNHDLAAGLDACNRALQIVPGDFDALDGRGFIKFRLGDLAGALADYDAALASRPRAAGSLYMRGVVKLRLGRAADGKVDADAAAAIDPDIVSVYAGYGVSP
ncbi:MAG: tetratricopeptide repeat protein [Rhizomicrobium sp.]